MVNRTFKRSYVLDSYYDSAEHKGLAINTDTMVEAVAEVVKFLDIAIKFDDKSKKYQVKYPGKKKFEELPNGSDFGAGIEALYRYGKYVVRGVQKEL
jgi:hypothetical protein